MTPPLSLKYKIGGLGFTLIELLVAIGIVAVLVALILPITSAVLERTRAAGCLNNLRGFGVAFQSYASDNSGYLVHSDGDWESLLDGYVSPSYADFTNGKVRSSHSIFVCPSVHPITGNLYYGLNGEFRASSPPKSPDPSLISQASISYPSRHVILSDTSGSRWITTSHVDSMLNVNGLTNRHNGHPNFLYADGHAAAFMLPLLGYSDTQDPFYLTLWLAHYRQP